LLGSTCIYKDINYVLPPLWVGPSLLRWANVQALTKLGSGPSSMFVIWH